MTLTLDLLSLIGLACLALFLVMVGVCIGAVLAKKDYREAFARGRESGLRQARVWWTEKVDSGEITFSEAGGRKKS